MDKPTAATGVFSLINREDKTVKQCGIPKKEAEKKPLNSLLNLQRVRNSSKKKIDRGRISLKQWGMGEKSPRRVNFGAAGWGEGMNGLVVPKIPRTYMQRKLNIFFLAKNILVENYCGKQNIQLTSSYLP